MQKKVRCKIRDWCTLKDMAIHTDRVNRWDASFTSVPRFPQWLSSTSLYESALNSAGFPQEGESLSGHARRGPSELILWISPRHPQLLQKQTSKQARVTVLRSVVTLTTRRTYSCCCNEGWEKHLRYAGSPWEYLYYSPVWARVWKSEVATF